MIAGIDLADACGLTDAQFAALGRRSRRCGTVCSGRRTAAG